MFKGRKSIVSVHPSPAPATDLSVSPISDLKLLHSFTNVIRVTTEEVCFPNRDARLIRFQFIFPIVFF